MSRSHQATPSCSSPPALISDGTWLSLGDLRSLREGTATDTQTGDSLESKLEPVCGSCSCRSTPVSCFPYPMTWRMRQSVPSVTQSRDAGRAAQQCRGVWRGWRNRGGNA